MKPRSIVWWGLPGTEIDFSGRQKVEGLPSRSAAVKRDANGRAYSAVGLPRQWTLFSGLQCFSAECSYHSRGCAKLLVTGCTKRCGTRRFPVTSGALAAQSGFCFGRAISTPPGTAY